MDLTEAIASIEARVEDPTRGLPQELFLFASQITPMVNVDLLIKDDDGRTLLSWRDDVYCGSGWHVPGGIVRYKEPMLQRLERVAQVEIGRPVGYDPRPLAVNELIIEQKVRGHFISFLHRCTLPRGFAPDNGDLGAGDVGYLRWHAGCPDDLLRVQELYRAYIDDATGYGVNEEGRQ